MKKISGVGRWHIIKNFFKRFNDPYDLRIRNAADGEVMLHIALTKKSVFMLLSTFLVLTFFTISFLFLFTPIKYYIPGFETPDSRKKMLALKSRMDSLENFQRGYGLILDNAFAVASDDEDVLLDTMGLSPNQLNRAEMENRNEIATNIGIPMVVGKRPVPVDSTKKKTLLPEKIEEKMEIKAEPVKEVKVKKRDTVIIYK